MKVLLKIPASILGYLINQFPKFRNFIRKIHFKGKYTLICYIDIDKTNTIVVECDGVKYELDLQDGILRCTSLKICVAKSMLLKQIQSLLKS
jgi:hypothetical protein